LLGGGLVTDIAAIEARSAIRPERIKTRQPRRRGHLSSAYECLLVHGDTEGFYDGDGSRLVGAIIMDAVNNGCNPEGIFQKLSDPQNKGGFTSFRRKRPDLRRWFDGDWKRAEHKVAYRPKLAGRQEAVFMARSLREEADTMQWRGTAGGTDRAVYDALLEIGEQLGKLLDVGASVRQVGERAGVGRETASKSLKRLRARGLITQSFAGHGKVPARWNLMPRLRSIPDNQPHTGAGVVGPDCPGGFALDSWRWRGLGKSKAKIWRLLGSEPVTTSDLAGTLGVTPRTVQQHLARLRDVGLATRVADGWVKGPDAPEQVGEWLSTAGAGVRQRERHRIERQAHRGQLQKFAIRKNSPPWEIDPQTGEIYPIDELVHERPDLSSAQVMQGRVRRNSPTGSGTPRRGRPKRSAAKARKPRSKVTRRSAEDLGMEMVS
jgi:DNA-binding MarR family transcriptional regulator